MTIALTLTGWEQLSFPGNLWMGRMVFGFAALAGF
jgi:hypothetical protein